MLLWLTQWFAELISPLSVFQYLTMRAIMATLTAFLVSLLLGPLFIRYLKSLKVGQTIREDGPQSHFSKAGTPTMGGALILCAILSSVFLWADLSSRAILLVVFVTVSLGLLGFIDDYRKLKYKNSKGVSAKVKYTWQSVVALIFACMILFTSNSATETTFFAPFFKNFSVHSSLLFVFLTYFVIVGASNAVNLTDGLDGLAIVPAVLIGGALGIFAYLSGHAVFANYLAIPFVPGIGELIIFSAALAGAGLGFLWFNTYPAQVFMGDMGALALGGALGAMAVLSRQEIVFFIMSGVFVIETVSVILQVSSFRLTGKRIFKMAPLHHHFELLGWPEPRVIVRFWIITVILVLFGLATLKLR